MINSVRVILFQGGRLDKQEKLLSKAPKKMIQTKLSSLYGDFTKVNCGPNRSGMNHKINSDDCMVIEKSHLSSNLPKEHDITSDIKVSEEEKGHLCILRMKRAHTEINSPKKDYAMPPASNDEADDVSGNGFVTARTKLVYLLPVSSCFCIWPLEIFVFHC